MTRIFPILATIAAGLVTSAILHRLGVETTVAVIGGIAAAMFVFFALRGRGAVR